MTPPESPSLSISRLTLDRATSTMDDLTAALASFSSRGQTPEPGTLLACCCGRDDCEHTRAWLAFKAKLEERLILSAEVGQALLEKHEAYLRRHERNMRQSTDSATTEGDDAEEDEATKAEARMMAEMRRVQGALEKRLAQALVDAEVAESARASLDHELTEARSTVARLSTAHARSVGWDARLKTAQAERDDMQQERDAATARARMAEQRAGALRERCGKLQTEVRALDRDVQAQRQHRLELSEDVLRDARSRLEMLRHAASTPKEQVDEGEVTKVLETLVADNEDLKRGNAELQNLLAEAREDVHGLREEVEELRAVAPVPPVERPTFRHRHTNSVASSVFSDVSAGLAPSFAIGTAPSMPTPLTPRSMVNSHRAKLSVDDSPEHRRPLSPSDSITQSETKWTSFVAPDEADEDHDTVNDATERRKSMRTLFLLTRERGVQTDGWSGLLSPAPGGTFAYSDRVSSISPGEGRSESSSLAESAQSAVMASLLDRVALLLNRMSQADALTLTNRLKRQHLGGPEMVGHLSRSTVDAIVHEATTLRIHYRTLLEDEKATTTCTRKDLRGLFKLFKDAFAEMGAMRHTLNEVILDPGTAGKVSEVAMNPSKADATKEAAAVSPGWMAPISKLFAGSSGQDSSTKSAAPPVRPGFRGRGTPSPFRPPSRLAPKSGPALSASGTTVNVEFSGTGVQRAVSSSMRQDSSVVSHSPSSRNVMTIFAGAPKAEADPWIVIPKTERPLRRTALSNATPVTSGVATIGRSTLRNMDTHRLSRNVDAVIDGTGREGEDAGGFHPRLLERTLRPRGLSDSSIHSTFTQHGEQTSPVLSPVNDGPPRRETWQERQSMFQALGRSFGFGTTPIASPALERRGSKKNGKAREHSIERAASPGLSALIPNLSLAGWAGGLDMPGGATVPHFGSPPDEGLVHRNWRETRGRDPEL